MNNDYIMWFAEDKAFVATVPELPHNLGNTRKLKHFRVKRSKQFIVLGKLGNTVSDDYCKCKRILEGLKEHTW